MSLKSRLRGTVFFKPIQRKREREAEQKWIESGCSTPPPASVKRRIIRHYLSEFGLDTLVETGTHSGDTVAFFQGTCAKIFSIELDKEYARAATERFRSDKTVRILQGDSAERLADVMKELAAPALFWLDGHYSGDTTARGNLDTPVMAELETIFAHAEKRHVVLIDDARLFTGANDYPSMDALRAFVSKRAPNLSMSMENDVIRCCPKR